MGENTFIRRFFKGSYLSIYLLIGIFVFFTGCITQQFTSTSTTTKITDSRPCMVNSSVKGNFLMGRTFKTFQEFPQITKAIAFNKVAASVVSLGWQITNSNKDAGIVSAQQTVSFGQGKSVALNVLLKDLASGGVRVEVIIQISGGISASKDETYGSFCQILESVDN